MPIYTRELIGSMTGKDGTRFDIMIGLDHLLVDQLKAYAVDDSDEELQRNTSDKKRFGEGSYEEWYAKERTPYALVTPEGVLAALAWFGPKPLGRKSLKYLAPEDVAQELNQPKTDWHTIVYRSYRPYRGTGLMTQFMQIVIGDYKKRHPTARLWAGVSQTNAASIALAERLGFKSSPDHVDTDAQWAALIQE